MGFLGELFLFFVIASVVLWAIEYPVDASRAFGQIIGIGIECAEICARFMWNIGKDLAVSLKETVLNETAVRE